MHKKYKIDIVAFLADVTNHLFDLNVKLQGKNQTIFYLMEAVRAFQKELQFFHRDLQEALLHVPKLDEYNQETKAKEGVFYNLPFQDLTIGQAVLLCMKKKTICC